jgi:Holliday junction resolvase-like predicted endonuclease
MPKVFSSKTQKTGEIGENIAVKFLVKHGYSIIDRNYTKKWGEIDIIAKKQGKLYFIEVKSVSRVTLPSFVSRETSKTNVSYETKAKNVTRDTLGKNEYRPEDNMHPWKLKRLSRTIQTYLVSNRIPEENEWQVDLMVVYLDLINKKAKINVISDIVL